MKAFSRGEGDFVGERFFAPGSAIWRVDQEMVLLLGGGRALLMQLAHPKVAEGVARHSRFRQDPLGRLYQTMNTMWSIVFDEPPQARASLQRVAEIHRSVRGTIQEGDVLPPGTSYDARDPDLLLWVHATLVDSALVTYELFVRPLPVQERQQYYDESRKLAFLFGVPESKTPGTLAAFDDYMSAMMAAGPIRIGATARALAQEILYPRPLVLRIGAPLSAFITNGLLPPGLRRAYGLEWDERKEKRLQLLAGLVRNLLPFIPAPLRIVPHARAARKRACSVPAQVRVQAENGYR